MADVPTDDEILSKLKHHRENILLALYRYGELRTREIREQVGFPSGSKEHHLGILEEWSLIEEVGPVHESGGISERVFGLTDAGCEFVENYPTEERERLASYEIVSSALDLISSPPGGIRSSSIFMGAIDRLKLLVRGVIASLVQDGQRVRPTERSSSSQLSEPVYSRTSLKSSR